MATVVSNSRVQNVWLTRAAQFREIGIVFLLVFVIVGTALIQPRFLTTTSLRSILLWVPLLAVVGMGQMMVIITRGIDVSVGSMVGLAGMAVGLLFRDVPGFGLAAAILISIAVGLAMGAVNGALVAWARVPPVIVTLGGFSVYRGLTFIISGGSQIDGNYIPTELIRWSQIGPFGLREVPWVIFIVAAVALLTHFFLQYTTVGRNIYAIGNNPDAARLRGVPIERTTFFVYVVTGAMCGLAGLLYASRFGFINPGQTGIGLELTVIAAVVIGGVNVYGGTGSVWGVLLGCLLLGSINVALSVLGIAGTWQVAVYGLVILLAVTVDSLLQRQLQRATGGE